MLHRKFEQNAHGRDFVVGDIHGCYDHLEQGLHLLGFDETRDRLFSVGDLVDRGPSSQDALDWIARPWFHAVRGNHEQDIISAATAGGVDRDRHIRNGAGWFYSLSQSRQQLYAKAFTTLPYAMSVETEDGRVGIVHAEVFGHWDDFLTDLAHGNERVITSALRGRLRNTHADTDEVAGVSRVYVGHTILRKITCLGNTVYLDTGAVKGGDLSILDVATDILSPCLA